MSFQGLTLIAIFPFVLLWLLACVRHDLRSREVPVWLTVAPLAIAGLIGVLLGRWAPACLVLALVLISDLPSGRVGTALPATLVLLLLDPALGWLDFSILATWLLWEKGAMGGADAKMILALLLLYGQAGLLLWIALAGGIQGVVAWSRKQKEIPYTVSILMGWLGFGLASIIR